MALGQLLDLTCKYKLDSIYRIAKSQGRLDWYHDIRGNDIKLQQVLSQYTLRTATGKRQGRNQSFLFMEQLTASTSTIIEEIGVMMTERQYMSFAACVEGGRLSELQAKQQWMEWSSAISEPGATWPPSDHKGVNKERVTMGLAFVSRVVPCPASQHSGHRCSAMFVGLA